MNTYNIMYRPSGGLITSKLVDGEDEEDAKWRLSSGLTNESILIIKTTLITNKEKLPVRSLNEKPNWNK